LIGGAILVGGSTIWFGAHSPGVIVAGAAGIGLFVAARHFRPRGTKTT
jgi:membrane-associated phospholipid phosphatase